MFGCCYFVPVASRVSARQPSYFLSAKPKKVTKKKRATSVPLREPRPGCSFASLTSWGVGLPHSSLLARARHAVPLHTPCLTSHLSLLTPHSSLLTPHSSLLTPHSSSLTPHSSLLQPHSSLPHPSPLTPHPSPSPRQQIPLPIIPGFPDNSCPRRNSEISPRKSTCQEPFLSAFGQHRNPLGVTSAFVTQGNLSPRHIGTRRRHGLCWQFHSSSRFYRR